MHKKYVCGVFELPSPRSTQKRATKNHEKIAKVGR
jgi:hypothetical protein